MSIAENYERACELIDIESCVDYYAVEMYIANTDWPYNNYLLWRVRNPAGNAYYDGKWRFVLYDLNISMFDADKDMLEFTIEQDPLFASLYANSEFQQQFNQRLVYLANNIFNMETVDEFIDNYENQMQAAMEKEYERYYGDNKSVDDFITECEGIRLFFQKRYEYIMDEFG